MFYGIEYDETKQICCSESNSTEFTWICSNSKVCVSGGKCRYKNDKANYENIVYTTWFAFTLIQLAFATFFYFYYGDGSLDIKLLYSFIRSLLLSLSLFTIILSLILTIIRSKLFLILLFGMLIIFISIVVACIKKWDDYWCFGTAPNYYGFRDLIERKINTFQGKNREKKKFRSSVQIIDPIPDLNKFTIRIKYQVVVGNDQTPIKTGEYLVFKKFPRFNIFSACKLNNFLEKAHISFVFDCYVFFLQSSRGKCMIEIVQETSNDDDPAFPFDCKSKGDYVCEDFFNLDYQDRKECFTDIRLGKRKLDYDECNRLSPLNPNEDEIINLPQ